MTVTDCTHCPALVKTRGCIVNGFGDPEARIVFVGEGPGQTEDAKRRPFVGKAGRVLKIHRWAAGIDQHHIWDTNATRCWGKRNPTPGEVDNCHDYLIQELKELNPAVIVSLGGPALRSLYRPNVNVSDVMGFTLYNDELPGIPIIPTYHPSYIMRGNWGEVGLVLAHFRKAKRIAETEDWQEKPGSYMGITTLEELHALREYLLGPEVEFISIDTETTGLSWMEDELLCISFSGEQGIGYSVPVLHRGEQTKMVLKGRGKNRKEVPEQEFVPVPFWPDEQLPEVLAILQDILGSDKPKAGQNIEFDIRFLERRPDEVACKAATAFGFWVNNVEYDTRVLSSLLFENIPHNLKVLNAYWTDIPYYDVPEFKSKMWHLPDQKLWEYGAADVDAVQTLAPMLMAAVKEEQGDYVYHNISVPMLICANRLTERGVYIDQDYFDRLCLYYKAKLEQERQEVDAVVGRHVEHPTHYEHLQKLLFDELGLPLTQGVIPSAFKGAKKCGKCERGNPCSPKHAATGADALEELNQQAPHPILPVLIRLKTTEKFYSTYLEGGQSGGFRAHIREDGRIHGKWNAGRADTGRFTCEEPNLMNPPKEIFVDAPEYGLYSKDAIRSMFSAPPGYTVLNADWSQLEVWVLAYETGDPTLLDLLLSGKDVHVYVARKICELGVSRLFPHEAWQPELSDDEWKVKHPDLRNKAKTFFFGLSYQLTEQGAADRLGCILSEAHDLFVAFLTQVFPTLPHYSERIQQEIMTDYGVRNRFDRRRHFPEAAVLGALGFWTDLQAVIRQGINYPIQSGGHDLHSLAHIRTEALLAPGLVAPTLEMHDSLMAETPLNRIEEAAWEVKKLWESLARGLILSDGSQLGWEIPVEVSWGPSFGDLQYTLTHDGRVVKIVEESA